MKAAIRICATTAATLALTGAAFAANPKEQAAQAAHDAYVTAINANDLDQFLATVTDDVVFIAPNSPVLTGKAEVGPWVGGYFDAFRTTWEKTSLELVVAGNWAFERYTYRAVDTPRSGGSAVVDTGSGMNIFRLEPDGVWRVARDIWASSGEAALEIADPVLPDCLGAAAPC